MNCMLARVWSRNSSKSHLITSDCPRNNRENSRECTYNSETESVHFGCAYDAFCDYDLECIMKLIYIKFGFC